MATAIQAAMVDAEAGWTVTYSLTTQQFFITPPAARTLSFSITANSIANTIGYNNVDHNIAPPSSVPDFVVPEIPGTNTWFVRSSTLTTGKSYTNWQAKPSDIIETVYLGNEHIDTDTLVSWVVITPPNPRKIFGGGYPNYLTEIDLRLTDDRGNAVSLNNTSLGWKLELVAVCKDGDTSSNKCS